jgi:uncharacterized protein
MDDLPITAVLTQTHGQTLLASARQTLTAYLLSKEIQLPQTSSPPLTQNAGAFVTLRVRQLPIGADLDQPGARLRGCIGHIQPDTPLFQIVPVMAIRAATADPRFPPMSIDELDNIQIEISVLSLLTLVKNIAEIEVGKHGLFLEVGSRRGLLLPEVPVRRGWDREQFLQAVCRKANLPPNFWQNSKAKLSVFITIVFEEA